MKTQLTAIGLAVLLGLAPASVRAAGTNEYQAFWLTRNEKGNEYVDLVLSHHPLSGLVGASSTDTNVLDSDAVVVTTYAKDSVWNMDRHPCKALRQVNTVNDGEVMIAGQFFTWTKADMKDVVRLLENPEGKIAIHRIYAASAGQEDDIKELAARIRKQIKDEANRLAGTDP